jgi:CheY-like chemotaxis protein
VVGEAADGLDALPLIAATTPDVVLLDLRMPRMDGLATLRALGPNPPAVLVLTTFEGPEVLSYIPGTAVIPPYPAWALTDAALVSVALLLRRYHEAVVDFGFSGHTWPQSAPEPYSGELISHNDPNLDNVVFREGRAVAFIDFDLASPGSRLWDVAAAVRLWAPLRDDVDISDARRGRALERFRRMIDAYGLNQTERINIVDAIQENHNWLYSIIRSAADHGDAGFADYWEQAASRVGRTHHWYRENYELLVKAAIMPSSDENEIESPGANSPGDA